MIGATQGLGQARAPAGFYNDPVEKALPVAQLPLLVSDPIDAAFLEKNLSRLPV
jgi:hypothetical protein